MTETILWETFIWCVLWIFGQSPAWKNGRGEIYDLYCSHWGAFMMSTFIYSQCFKATLLIVNSSGGYCVLSHHSDTTDIVKWAVLNLNQAQQRNLNLNPTFWLNDHCTFIHKPMIGFYTIYNQSKVLNL